MRLFTQNSENQFNYIGDYDIAPSGNLIDERNGSPVANRPMTGNARRYLNRYKKTTIGMVVGLIVGILFITIGFFKTLLLAILIGIGFSALSITALRGDYNEKNEEGEISDEK